MRDTKAFREQIGRIEELVRGVEATADPATRAAAKELVQAVMDLHGAAIERMMETIRKSGDSAAGILRSFCADELVGSLLVLYDQSPEDFTARVQRGVERAQQVLRKRGASVTVLGTDDFTVRLRLDAGKHGCGSTSAELEGIARGAVLETAPDAVEISVEPAQREVTSGFVPLESLSAGSGAVRVPGLA